MKKLRKAAAALLCAALVTASANALTVSAAGTVYAKTTADLNVRKGAGMNYDRITMLDENTKVTVVDRSNPDWLKVKLSNGTTGYCYADYLDITTDGYTTDYVNVRYGASTNYGIIKTVPTNTKVDIIRFSGVSWAYVKLPDGTKGYMCTDYITYSPPSSTKTSSKAVSTDIKLSDNSKKIAVGTSYTIKASNNLGTVNWTSSDPKIAKVDKGGKVTAVSAGSAIITAQDAKTKKSVKCTITAVKTDFTKITLSDTSKTLSVGESFTLKVTTDTNSKNVKFKSSDKNVASVDQNGKITAVSSGSANVKAYDSKGVITAVCKITVKGNASISLSASSMTVEAGSSKVLTAKTSDPSMKVTWTSSNPNIASVRDGRVSGLSTGTAVITASDSTGKIFAKCDVTVKSVSKGNLYISRNKFATTVGKDFILKGEEVSAWSTSDSYLATVSDNGIVHAHHSGRVAITYSDSKGHKVVCAVSIGTAEPVRAVYNSPNLAKTGQQIKLLAVTDKTVSAVRFKVSRDGNSFFVNSSSKTEKNGRYIWTAVCTVQNEGHFTTVAYATRNGKESTCEDAKGDFYISNRDRSSSYLGTHYATDESIGFIREKEGLTSAIRDDALAPGNLTVGYGHVMGEGTSFYNNMIFEEANALLIKDLNHGDITSVLNNFFNSYKLKCNQQQFDALTSFAYNFGPYWMDKYDFGNDFRKISSVYYGGSAVRDVKDINRNTFIGTITQFTLSEGNRYWGLLYRRIDEAEIFLYGDYKNDGRNNKYNLPYPSHDYR